MKNLKLLLTACITTATVVHGQVTTSFNVDLSPNTQNYAANSTSNFSITYTIDGSGNIASDAIFDTGGAARWNQIDDSNAGTTTSSELYNTSFTLTYSGTANAFLTYSPSYDNAGTGAVLTTQGQGNVNALENGESITFTVSGTSTAVSGFALDLVDFSYDLRLANGGSSFGVQDTTGTIVEQKIPNTSLSGTINGAGISLSAGEAMTFRTIAGNAGGAGLQGFSFNVSATAVPEPSSYAIMGGLIAMAMVLLRRRRA